MDKEPADLKTRLQQARDANAPAEKDGINESHAYGMAMRLVAELLSGLIVGLIVGYFLDKWLGTKPWLFIIFIFLGLGAGIFNVMRAAKQIEARQAEARQARIGEEAEQATSNAHKAMSEAPEANSEKGIE